MHSSTFIFAPKLFEDRFHRLDQEIAAVAKGIVGDLGEEAWENTAAGLVSNVYSWGSMEALQQLVSRPRHVEAKSAGPLAFGLSGRRLAGDHSGDAAYSRSLP